MSEDIKGVLLDLGKVLIALDGARALATLLNVTATREEILERWGACSAVRLFETGRLSESEFATRTVAELGLPLSPEDFLVECRSWLGGPIKEACDLVQRIPRHIQVGVLSNMGPLHWADAEGHLPTRIERLFVSWQIGIMKPEPEAFRIALRWFTCPPSEVLFLDDAAINVEAALAQGMNARVVLDATDINAALRDYGVLRP